jgi:chemotaxis signal transduction protein
VESPFLNRPIPHGLRAEWAATLASQAKASDERQTNLFVFRLGTEWFGLEPGYVREVTRAAPVRSLPRANAQSIGGLINVRGRVLVLVKLAGLFQVSPRPADGIPQRLLVLRYDEWRFSALVDEVTGFVVFPTSEMLASPIARRESEATFARGLFAQPGRSITWLNAERLFQALREKLV